MTSPAPDNHRSSSLPAPSAAAAFDGAIQALRWEELGGPDTVVQKNRLEHVSWSSRVEPGPGDLSVSRTLLERFVGGCSVDQLTVTIVGDRTGSASAWVYVRSLGREWKLCGAAPTSGARINEEAFALMEAFTWQDTASVERRLTRGAAAGGLALQQVRPSQAGGRQDSAQEKRREFLRDFQLQQGALCGCVSNGRGALIGCVNGPQVFKLAIALHDLERGDCLLFEVRRGQPGFGHAPFLAGELMGCDSRHWDAALRELLDCCTCTFIPGEAAPLLARLDAAAAEMPGATRADPTAPGCGDAAYMLRHAQALLAGKGVRHFRALVGSPAQFSDLLLCLDEAGGGELIARNGLGMEFRLRPALIDPSHPQLQAQLDSRVRALENVLQLFACGSPQALRVVGLLGAERSLSAVAHFSAAPGLCRGWQRYRIGLSWIEAGQGVERLVRLHAEGRGALWPPHADPAAVRLFVPTGYAVRPGGRLEVEFRPPAWTGAAGVIFSLTPQGVSAVSLSSGARDFFGRRLRQRFDLVLPAGDDDLRALFALFGRPGARQEDLADYLRRFARPVTERISERGPGADPAGLELVLRLAAQALKSAWGRLRGSRSRPARRFD